MYYLFPSPKSNGFIFYFFLFFFYLFFHRPLLESGLWISYILFTWRSRSWLAQLLQKRKWLHTNQSFHGCYY
jgi:hypothetical protein